MRAHTAKLEHVVSMLLVCLPLVAAAQTEPHAPNPTDTCMPVLIQNSLPPDGWVSRNGALEFELDRAIEPTERVVVFIGRTDVTALFQVDGHLVRYGKPAPRLPNVESELVIYLVTHGRNWSEIGRFTYRALAPLRLRRAYAMPKADLDYAGAISRDQILESPEPRDTHHDVSLHTGVQTAHANADWKIRSHWNFLGVSKQEQALQFLDKGNRAPRFDLADFGIVLEKDRAELSFGHLFHGGGRSLISGVSGRGMRAETSLGPALRISAVAMSSSQLVGWEHFTGLDRSNHVLYAGSVGFEAFPSQPGALRLDAHVIDAARLPLDDFTQGAVQDAEKSRGFEFQVVASDPKRILSLGAGMARSRFTNPDDPTLARGAVLVPARESTRNAYYLDGELRVLRSRSLGASWQTSLGLGYRLERTDPLYRSIGAFTQADRFRNDFALDWSLNRLELGLGYSEGWDNLDELPSVLRTRTRGMRSRIGFPLSLAFGPEASVPWLPDFESSWGRVHQSGENLPSNGDFDPSHVPDQVSADVRAGLRWNGPSWNLGYRFGYSDQDNRQPGREDSDFRSTTHFAGLGIELLRTIRLGFDGSLEGSRNEEIPETATTRHVSGNLAWQPSRRTSLSAFFSATWRQNDPRTSTARSSEWRLEASREIHFLGGYGVRGIPLRLFARYSRQHHSATLAGVVENRRIWNLNTGINAKVF